MKLYIKQKVFSWADRFRVYDGEGNDIYSVQGEIISLGKRLHLCDMEGRELALIRQKLLALLPKYFIEREGADTVCVTRKLTLLRPVYTVDGPGWTVNGDLLAHEYQIEAAGRTVAAVAKRWFSWGDTYEIDIADGEDELLALCVVLVVDAVTFQTGAATVSMTSSH